MCRWVKVGGRADRVSGTKPPPKINAAPATPFSGCPVADLRAPGAAATAAAAAETSLGPDTGPVTGTTCHQLHHSPNGSPLDQRHGWQTVCCPTRAAVYSAHAHIHKHSCAHKHSRSLPPTSRPSPERPGGPLYENTARRGAGDNVWPDLWIDARLPSFISADTGISAHHQQCLLPHSEHCEN